MSNPYDCFFCHNEGYDHAPDCPYHPERLAAAEEEYMKTALATPDPQTGARRSLYAFIRQAIERARSLR